MARGLQNSGSSVWWSWTVEFIIQSPQVLAFKMPELIGFCSSEHVSSYEQPDMLIHEADMPHPI